ncbi:MAG: hypothetical protein DHS20C15_30470 [Planctomycetota bacterium]|nr:MAG: hypothetical protein DHS20C15_30470 [Planctomycetota bacterium]
MKCFTVLTSLSFAFLASATAIAAPQVAEGDTLSLWSQPAFQAEFTRSYLSDTEVEPGLTSTERDRMQKVLEYLGKSERDKAIELLEKNLGDASSAVFDFTLANLHFEAEELERAAQHYASAVAKHPKFRRAWNNLGYVHVRRNDFAAALPAFTKVLEFGGASATTYGLLGYASANLGNQISAESAYRMAILMDPATLDWKMGLARSLFEQARYADAVALCDILIAEQPERADLWMLQANAYIGLKEPLRAAENFELADQLGGSSAASLNMLGDIYINEQLFELGVERYVRALELDTSADPARALRAAQVMAGRGALDEAEHLVQSVETLKAGLLEDSQRKELLRLRARVAVARGASDEEARLLEEIVALDPFDGDALILLGQHSERGGDAEQAIFYFERAANLEAFEADAKVRHAQLLVGQSRYAEALPLLTRAQSLKPREAIAEYLEQVKRLANVRS